MIEWGKPDERYFSTGTDRGVIYPHGKPAVAWNGIIGVTESGAGDTSVLYRDGQIFYTSVEPGDYAGTLTAFFWPDAFSECLGIPEIAPGLHADYQKPKHFDLTYRSLVGSGARGDMFGYQIHLIYNAIASINQRTRKTKTNSPSLDEFGFDLVATPRRVRGYRPTAHFIIDSRGLEPLVLAGIENTLYVTGEMPDPQYLYQLLKYGNSVHFDTSASGRALVFGPAAKVYGTNYGSVMIKSVTGVDNAGKLTLSDTP